MLNNKSRIFVLNYAGHDLEDAKRFADEFVYLTEGNLHFKDLDRMKFTISQELTRARFDPDHDFILLSGSVILGYLLGRILDEYHIKLLLWDAKTRTYSLREDMTPAAIIK
jgi:hypothetical protein